ncbi:hypothetical protein [Variovorax paradoxus]|uniref:hypothetical protein n=1 Tax=Variovorax paradoxus TaxID=34073 RepID=UPI003D64600B
MCHDAEQSFNKIGPNIAALPPKRSIFSFYMMAAIYKMCYFLRIFSQTLLSMQPIQMADAVKCSVSIGSVVESQWRELVFKDSNQKEMMFLERSLVSNAEELQSEIADFVLELQKNSSPNTKWVVDYLRNTRVIYTIEVASLQDMQIAQRLQTEIWLKVNGILQSDIEGFRDELGYLVVASETTLQGVQRVALLKDERWVRFSINTADEIQRRSFLAGEVPMGIAIHAIG